MSVTVACVWVEANVPYGVEYVARLRDMVAKYLPTPHRFVCLTDRPRKLPRGVEGIKIPNPQPLPGWWSKVRLFDPAMEFSGRVLYLDLDSLIVAPLDRIVRFPSSFALIPDAGSFQPPNDLKVVRRFNSSAMVWDTPGPTDLFTEWAPSVAKEYWGDQDLIGLRYPKAGQFPIEWFPRVSAIRSGPVPSGAIVVLSKTPKPKEAARKWQWANAAWSAS